MEITGMRRTWVLEQLFPPISFVKLSRQTVIYDARSIETKNHDAASLRSRRLCLRPLIVVRA